MKTLIEFEVFVDFFEDGDGDISVYKTWLSPIGKPFVDVTDCITDAHRFNFVTEELERRSDEAGKAIETEELRGDHLRDLRKDEG